MFDRLPVVFVPRPLVPGARMAVRAEGGAGEGGLVLAAFGESVRRGGVVTRARIEGVEHAFGGQVIIGLTGVDLVLVVAEEADGSLTVRAVDPPEADLDATPETVGTALRRYMAVRAEAGRSGDVHITLSGDPVTASHQVASNLEVSAPEVQDILEAGDAHARLRRETGVLERETALLRAVLGRTE